MATPQVRFLDDTLREMARWAARRYDIAFDVLFSEHPVGKGRDARSANTCFFRNGPALIELNTHRTHSELADVLAHEIAHVVTFKRDRTMGHGPIFRRNFNRLIVDWNIFVARGKA